MRISDWSSDVCSSDLTRVRRALHHLSAGPGTNAAVGHARRTQPGKIVHVPEAGARPMPTDTFNTQFPPEGNWTPSQLKLAFSLYLQLPFGQFHNSNWPVQSLPALLHRSPRPVAITIVTFPHPHPPPR